METAELRVTSIWQQTKTWVAFSGVPLVSHSYKTKSARSIVFIKTTHDCLPMLPMVGQHWRVTGEMEAREAVYVDYKITEWHFTDPTNCEVTLPSTGEDFIRFIARERDFKGIGEVKARELWSYFGKDIFRLLNNKGKDTFKALLSEQSTTCLFEGYEKYANLKYSTWFAEHKIPPQIQQRLFKYHKDQSIDLIKENPFVLIAFGMPFKKCDDLARESFNIGKEDSRRLIAAIEYTLKEYARSGGHTVAHRYDIESRLSRYIGPLLVKKAMSTGLQNRTFIFDDKTGNYHNTALLIMENVVAKRLKKLVEASVEMTDNQYSAINKAAFKLPYKLTPKQLDAVVTSLSNNVSCITGGAGTGKTTVLKTVLRAYAELGFDILAVALSGRAAMRLRESIGMETFTIAKFLRDEPLDKQSKTIIVIDEASMVDIGTMYKIVQHMHSSVRILFVGDPNQLPPIGAGLVLSEIIKSNVISNTELDIVQRQDESTGIPEYSKMVCVGKVPPHLSVGNITFHNVAANNVAKTCTRLYAESPTESRIISATKVITEDINKRCQDKLNSQSKTLEVNQFGDRYLTDIKVNDPVLFTQNNYDAGVQNGSLGRLIAAEQTDRHFGIVKLDDNVEEINLTKTLLDSLMLGYAITLHKAQGSQFRRVIVALNDTAMIDRAWLYTAITRSEVELHLVGTKVKMHQAIRSLSAHHKRKTHLSSLLTA